MQPKSRYFQNLNQNLSKVFQGEMLQMRVNDSREQVLDYFSQFLNSLLEVINDVKAQVYTIANLDISDSSRSQSQIKPQFSSILVATKTVFASLSRIGSILRGYSQVRIQSKQRKNRIITDPVETKQSENRVQHPKTYTNSRRKIQEQKYNLFSFSNDGTSNLSSQKLRKQNIQLKAKVKIVGDLLNSKNEIKTISQNTNQKVQKLSKRENIIHRKRQNRRQSIQKRNNQCLQIVRSLMKSLSPSFLNQKDQKYEAYRYPNVYNITNRQSLKSIVSVSKKIQIAEKMI